jgi:hypothetical protein
MIYLLLAALAFGQDTDEPDTREPEIEDFGPPLPADLDLDLDGVPDQADVIPFVEDVIAYDPSQLTVQQRIEHVEAQSARTTAILEAIQEKIEEEAAAEEAAAEEAAEEAAAEEVSFDPEDES